jgi:hypothetical protein
MSLSNAAETDLLNLLFNNTNWANLGDATGLRSSTVAGSFYVSLHTADPGEAGNQTTSEATYTGYARVAVARSAGGWTVSGNTVSNTAIINFGACTAGSNTITHFAIGRDTSGVGEIIVSGVLGGAGSLAVSAGITPSFAALALSASAE